MQTKEEGRRRRSVCLDVLKFSGSLDRLIYNRYVVLIGDSRTLLSTLLGPPYPASSRLVQVHSAYRCFLVARPPGAFPGSLSIGSARRLSNIPLDWMGTFRRRMPAVPEAVTCC